MSNKPPNKTAGARAAGARRLGVLPPASVQNDAAPSRRRQKIGAAAAGAGTGTLMVVLAQNLPESTLKSWLVLAAPTASAALSWIWTWIRELVEIRVREREKRQLFATVRKTIVDALEDPLLSHEHKVSLRRQLEELEMLRVSGLYQRIKLLESA
jgi:hypothetical protein